MVGSAAVWIIDDSGMMLRSKDQRVAKRLMDSPGEHRASRVDAERQLLS